MTDTKLVQQALKVAKKYPVFPTVDKVPCWSNKELGVGRGEGGYKVASQDPERVRELFGHERAKEIAVPMGEMSGLVCIDVDLYKDPNLHVWMEANKEHLSGTLRHETRSGGIHIFFRHPGNGTRFPSTLRKGVDVKAGGTGYVCFPPTAGYSVLNGGRARAFPLPFLEAAMKEKGGTGKTTVGSAFNDASDMELIASIQQAEELYPALRTLSYRMPLRKDDEGVTLDEATQVEILQNIMDSSVAAETTHARHADWEDRYGKIPDLVRSAIEKHNEPLYDDEAFALMEKAKPLFDLGRMTADTRPIGPQRETTLKDIERRVAELPEPSPSDTGVFETETLKTLDKRKLKPIEWLIPQVLPLGGSASLAGTSNVGKTRWLAALAALGSAGEVGRMGLPYSPRFATLWIANEERVEDIWRRVKACGRQHSLVEGASITVRGKDAGMLRLVGLNENGDLEIDEDNIAIIVAEARRVGCQLIILDPYVTLSDAVDENSAASAAIITKAMILLSSATGCAVMHAHHTPKDRSKDNDWYRGDAGAWRGSGAIYSALDCGYTLSNWMPKSKAPRKLWKDSYLDNDLSRWIVLDTGKIREGKAHPPIVYELVEQALDRGEGDPIGVCRLSSEAEAEGTLMDDAVDIISGYELARAIWDVMGPGTYEPQQVHKAMRGHKVWVYGDGGKFQGRHLPDIHSLLGDPMPVPGGLVSLVLNAECKTKGRWTFTLAEEENGPPEKTPPTRSPTRSPKMVSE